MRARRGGLSMRIRLGGRVKGQEVARSLRFLLRGGAEDRLVRLFRKEQPFMQVHGQSKERIPHPRGPFLRCMQDAGAFSRKKGERAA